MRVLLDTQAVLFWIDGGKALDSRSRSVIEDPRNEILVSSISAAEVAIKRAIGKLTAPAIDAELLDAEGFVELSFTATHAARLIDLPLHHRDPFDRMLVAQAQVEDVVFLSFDRQIDRYEYRRLPETRRI
jgi:PIN domain nuclease of toxin-antitoxin system